MIIDVTDFTNRPYKVPNQEESRDFASFIRDVEERLGEGTLHDECVKLLGADLFADFTAGLETSGEIDPFFVSLRDGGTYTYNNKTYRYGGWVDMVRPAIFSKWIPQTTDKLTNIGYVKNNAPQQSKLTEDNYPTIVQFWNEFARKVGYDSKYSYNYKNTFYGFMKANEDNFENWEFVCPTFKNRHDF